MQITENTQNMYTEELIVFTHNDLDALGCMLNIEFKFPNIKKKYFHTNYSNIPERVDEIIQYMDKTNAKHLIIPDVSFATNRESLELLYSRNYKITHIDHHLYPEGFWDSMPNMKVVWDTQKCATVLCNEYFGNKGKNSNLDKLSYIIDIYDLWQIDNPAFSVAQDLNNYFWSWGIEWIMHEMIKRNYRLPGNYTETVTQFNKKSSEAIKKARDKNLIMRNGELTICFVNDYFNQVLIEEMNVGQMFVVGVNDYGIIRIRINQKTTLTDEQINKIRKETTGEDNTGHLHAFTYKMTNSPSYTNIMNEIQRVATIIANTVNSANSINKD